MKKKPEAPPEADREIVAPTEQGPLSTPEPVRSHAQCPLLIEEAHISPGATDEDGIVLRESARILERPTACPSCGTMVEAWMLSIDAYGNRDCAAALSSRSNPRYAKFFAAVEDGNPDEAVRLARALGGVGARLLEVFGRA